jgi:thioesterase domain-containing protein
MTSPLICTLSTGGEGPPLFVIPSVGSTPLALVRLARSIAPRRVVHAFSYAGMEDDLPPHRTVEAMATAYVAELLACSPRGPYLVGGHCFGGAVALEMALQLEARGETVTRLVALDSMPPPLAVAAPGHVAAAGADPVRSALEHHGRSVLETVVARARSNHALLPAGIAHRLGGVLKLHIDAAIAYRTRRLCAPVHVLCTGGGADVLMAGWAAIAGGGVAAEEVPGDTFSMLAPPHVEVVGRNLGAALEAGER